MKMDDCAQLHDFLSHQMDSAVVLDCAAVTRLGGLAAQLIAMGAQTWAAANQTFSLSNPSIGFRQSLEDLGFSHLLTQEGSQG